MEVISFSVEKLSIQSSKIPLVASSFEQRSSGKSFLPELVVGYSSGENEILSIPFIKSRLIHFDEYAQSCLRGEKFTKPESSLVYIDSEMSQAVLLACLIFENENTLKPLRDELGIHGLRSFRMHLGNHVMNIGDREGGLHKYPVLNQIEDRIQVLRNIATSFFEEPINEETDENSIKEQQRYVLTLDFYVDETMNEALRDVFRSSIEMFQFFQLLYELNNNFLEPANITGGIKEEVYKSAGFYTDGKLPKPGPENMVFFFLDFMIRKKVNGLEEPIELLLREFSDGEHQFLHSMGICLLLKDKRTVMLLDEPETHFNPDWRSKFINVLNKSMEAGGGNNLMKDILLTSHSPFIISDCKRDNVFVFRNGEVFHPKINTFGASVGLVMDEVFLKDDTISDFAKEEILRLRGLPANTLDEINNVKEASRSVGESAEKVLLFRDLIVKENELKKTQ
jgi:restriction system-associated AAA family ATPase